MDAAPPTMALPDFPSAGPFRATPPLRAGHGMRLRHARHADLPWLCDLYASTRVEEMAGVPWPETAKQAFLADQFRLQHRHYVTHYADADFLVIEGEAGPVGRCYLQRGAPNHLLVDISLWPQQRGQGIGTQLISAAQQDAHSLGRGIHLHVLLQNVAARRLYERLGFVVIATQGYHHHMRWPATDT